MLGRTSLDALSGTMLDALNGTVTPHCFVASFRTEWKGEGLYPQTYDFQMVYDHMRATRGKPGLVHGRMFQEGYANDGQFYMASTSKTADYPGNQDMRVGLGAELTCPSRVVKQLWSGSCQRHMTRTGFNL